MKILGKELTFNGNKVYHAGNKPTASEIGAAASSHTHNYAGSSSAGGNANAAVKLATARTINGTSFDGSANITTANWGTARNIQIGNTSKSVNGSANVSWSLSEIGAAAASHGRHIPDVCETITDWNNATKNGWYMGNNATNSPTANAWYFGEVIAHNANYVVQTVYQFTASTDAKAIPKYIRAKMNGTWGAWTNVTVSKAVPSNAVFTDTNTWRGVQDNLTSTATDQSLSANQGKVLKGLIDGKAASSHTHNYAGSSSAGGAANSATKLATARSINGTNFDGTGNITTANWGTARNLNGVSVNGSTNYTIPVENYYCNVGDNNTNLYHRILTTDIATTNFVDKSLIIVMHSGYQGGGFGIAKITLRTNDISSAANSQGEIKWLVRNGFAENALVFNLVNQAKNACMDVFYKSPGTYAGMTWYVLSEGGRGGNHSKQWTKYNTNATGTNAYTEANMKTLRTYTSTLVSAKDAGHVSTANSASTLSTARTINGTSFNGSANITTANWGTARTLTVGKTGKSVNGSGNVSWSLAEIGAIGADTSGNYIGMTAPDGNTSNWIRTTTSGIIPANQNKESSIGTSSWQFKAMYAATFYGALSGNASTATKLQTARAINGTSFDGSANITTANWGTARNIQIGNTAKSVNGSANVTWSLSEIGAAAASHTHAYAPTATGSSISIHADSDSSSTSEYLLLKAGHNELKIASSAGGTTVTKGQDKLTFNGNVVYHAGRKPSLSELGAAASNHTHSYLPLSGGTLTGNINFNMHGRNSTVLNIFGGDANGHQVRLGGGAATIVGAGESGAALESIVGTAEALSLSSDQQIDFYTNCNTIDNRVKATLNNSLHFFPSVNATGSIGTSSNKWNTMYANTFYGALSGNASTATKLQTARSINGTNFDGSGNITTANWGTARNITIGNTTKSVNGSANVSWTAAEIGVASINDSTTATGTVWSSNKTQVQINTSYNTMSQKVDALEESINRDFVSKNGSTMTGDLTIKKSNGAAAKLNVHRTINSNDMQGTIDVYNSSGGAVSLSTNNKTSGKQTSSYVFSGDAFWSPRNADGVIPDIGTSSYRFKKAWLTDIDATGIINLKGIIYGKNNIALDRGSLWLQGVGGNLTCDYLRFGTNIMASSDNKLIYFIDTSGNRATVDCGELRATQCNIAGKKLFIQSGTPSGVATGDVWIQI